jgi:hypothetical protein
VTLDDRRAEIASCRPSEGTTVDGTGAASSEAIADKENKVSARDWLDTDDDN